MVDAGYAGAFVHETRLYWERWAQKLSQASGLNVIVKPGHPTKLETLDALRVGKVHIALLDPLSYLFGHGHGWVKPLAMSARNGQTARAIMFIARVDSGLKPGEQNDVFDQLANRRPCWPRWPWSRPTLPPLAEHFLPAGLLALHGTKLASPVHITGDYVETGVQAAVFRGVCDFAAVDAMPPAMFKGLLPGELQGTPFERWAQEMQVLHVTEPINPADVLVIAATAPAEVSTRIARAIQEVPEVGIQAGYQPFDAQLFAKFERIIAASGIDLRPYLAVPHWGPDHLSKRTTHEPRWVPTPRDTIVLDVPLQGGTSFLPDQSEELGRLVMPAIYAELVRLDASGRYMPYLAAEVPTLDNGLVRFVGKNQDEHLEVEFRLRPNLRWHDGHPLTADDLVFAWEWVMQPNWPGSHLSSSGLPAPELFVDRVVAPSPNRVIYRFMSQQQARQAAQTGGRLKNPALYAGLAQHAGPVVPVDYLEVGRNVLPRHILNSMPVEALAGSAFARRPIYAGAYRLVEGGEPGKPVILQAFAGFALGKPAIQRVAFGARYALESATGYWQTPEQLTKGLQARAIQAQLGLPAIRLREHENPQDYDALAARTFARVIWVPRDWWEVLDFNLDNPHLSDLRVRRAVAHAIDRGAIIDRVLGGRGELMRSYLPAWHPLYAGDTHLPNYAFDPQRARSLLQAAGYDISRMPAMHPTRGALTFEIASMDVAPHPRRPIAELIQKQLAIVGIAVHVRFYSWEEFEAQDCSGIRNSRKFDLGLAGWLGSAKPHPLRWAAQATTVASIPSPDNGCPFEKSNWSGWRNTRADETLMKLMNGRVALQQPDEYRRLWAEHQRLWATELPSLPLFNVMRPVVVAPDLVGVHPSPFAFGGGVEDTWNIHTWKRA
ncbi:MAG: hypothetical protein KatS3mg053_2252 [Candidatus Roseilinea sp.]|nr:MAG: hypothetical protein KatS3mg053_2252 [Candidatus Roseilinea sp.]